MRRGGPAVLEALAKYADELGDQAKRQRSAPPALQWEAEVYEWYGRLRDHVLTRSEVVAAGMGGAVMQKPCALDRTAWWPLIEKQGWSHRVVMALLDDIERATFDSLPTQDEQDHDE